MSGDGRLGRGLLGTGDIVFMVMAAAAPMAVVVALMPLAFAFGNGSGVPGTYLGAVFAMLLFAAGYVRIIPFVKNAGAFYAYIAAGVGRTAGLAAAYVAALCYFALSCSTLAALAFFSEQFFAQLTGLHTPWELWAAGSILLVAFLSFHRITLAAKVLAMALIAEIVVILVLDLAIVRDVGTSGFSFRDFSPGAVFAPGFGIAAIYAFNGMIGVEGTAIYQEEARDRRVTVPRATYVSVALVGLFYVFTAWCLASSVGDSKAGAIARENPGLFIIDRASAHLGGLGSNAISLLVLTSSVAAVLALFNNSTRYLYALARDGVLPRSLAKTHPRHRSPYVAGAVLAIALFAVLGCASIARLDPLLNVSTALVGLGSVGLMTLLAVTALAIPVFFARRSIFGLATTAAPAAGGLVIAAAAFLAFRNYSALTGVDSKLINNLPYLLVAVASAGAIQARWLRAHRPDLYERIGRSRVEGDDAPANELCPDVTAPIASGQGDELIDSTHG